MHEVTNERTLIDWTAEQQLYTHAEPRKTISGSVSLERVIHSPRLPNSTYTGKHLESGKWSSISQERPTMAYRVIRSRYSTTSKLHLLIISKSNKSQSNPQACVVPRPIGWISTRNKQTGVDNLAPYVHSLKQPKPPGTDLLSNYPKKKRVFYKTEM